MIQNGAVEVTTFHLARNKTLNDFIAENRDIDTWLRARPGFRSRHIFQDDSGRVHDVIFWDKEIHGTNSMKKLMEVFATSNVHALINQRTVNWFVQPVF